MRVLAALLVFAVSSVALAAKAPFVQITGKLPAFSYSCAGSSVTPTVPVDISIPPNASYNFVVSYVTDDMGMMMDYMDMMMMPMGGSLVTLFMSAPQNGPVVDSNAPFSIGRISTWYAYQNLIPDHTQMSMTINAYSGANGTGDVASTTTVNWDCSSGEIKSVVHMGNASGSSPTSLAKAVAIEYVNTSLGHFFMTTGAAEIAALDAGQISGWTRTGQSFSVFSDAAAGASAVCRYYIPPELGNSHFYSASSSECATVQSHYPAFTLESPSVFYIELPDAATGACPVMSVPVYRLWNARADSNHRYTTDRAVRNQMMASGYVAEGYGPDAVIMCAPL